MLFSAQTDDKAILSSGQTHPEVNVQVSATAKLAVADLEGDGHLVVGVQLLVEAFARVGSELDVVGGGEAYEGQ
jgi:hypothetical protein